MTINATARLATEKADFRPALLSRPQCRTFPEGEMVTVKASGVPPVEDTVMKFLNKATDWYARSAGEEFSQEMFGNCRELGMESPIEKLLWIAVHVVCKVNYLDINGDPISADGQAYGVHFFPQLKLDKYRADFSAYYHEHGKKNPNWIIECDGHDFHERTKQERQYEKQRDRFFTVRGYKILRFTGSEIVRDPCDVAAEVLRAVTGDSEIITPRDYYGS
jgi:very-short-patch-repair endonuclease